MSGEMADDDLLDAMRQHDAGEGTLLTPDEAMAEIAELDHRDDAVDLVDEFVNADEGEDFMENFDESMDGDAESALESVYGPDNDCNDDDGSDFLCDAPDFETD